MTASPAVSVVIPTYNRGRLLREAIRSVVEQTYTGWELIVVDDGSTDETEAVVGGFGDARIQFVPIAHSGSAAWARNAGIARACGTWIAFLDSDDRWPPQKLERQLEVLANSPLCQWSCTGFSFIDENGAPVPQRAGAPYEPISGWVLEPLITHRATASITTLMIRRSLIDDVGGFDETFGYCEDYELALRLAARAELCAMGDALCCIREHSGRSTKAPRVSELHGWNARVYRKTAAAAASRRTRSLCRRECARQLVAQARAFSREGARGEAAKAMAKAILMRLRP